MLLSVSIIGTKIFFNDICTQGVAEIFPEITDIIRLVDFSWVPQRYNGVVPWQALARVSSIVKV